MIYRSGRDASAVTKQGTFMEFGFGATSGDSVVALKSAQVPVTFKRRRIASPSLEEKATVCDSGDRSGAGDRPARVFRIEPTSRREAQEVALVDACAMAAVEHAKPHSGAGTKRRRGDAARAPGEVVRIVFERSSREPAAQSTVSPSVAPDQPVFGGQHERVLKALDDVRATLRAAQDAKQFRIA